MNRIRDLRKAKGLTLADLAVACDPPTTAQTIGRLETGMRSLSLTWMNRIAAALNVDPANLMRADSGDHAQIVAELGATGPEPLTAPREAVLPSDLSRRSRCACPAGAGGARKRRRIPAGRPHLAATDYAGR